MRPVGGIRSTSDLAEKPESADRTTPGSLLAGGKSVLRNSLLQKGRKFLLPFPSIQAMFNLFVFVRKLLFGSCQTAWGRNQAIDTQ